MVDDAVDEGRGAGRVGEAGWKRASGTAADRPRCRGSKFHANRGCTCRGLCDRDPAFRGDRFHLEALGDELERRGETSADLAAFGSAPPRVAVQGVPLSDSAPGQTLPPPRFLAVSHNARPGPRRDPSALAWLSPCTPVAAIAESIFLDDVSADADAHLQHAALSERDRQAERAERDRQDAARIANQ